MASEASESERPTSVFPVSDGEREGSGLQDILEVAAKLKEKRQDADDERRPEDSGVIVFSAGDAESDGEEDEDAALFGSFAGSLGAGFGTSVEPLAESAAASEATTGSTEVAPAPAAESERRNPLMVLALVLGLALVGAAAVYLTYDPEKNAQGQEVASEASMSAPGDAAVAKPADAAAGAEDGAVAEGEANKAEPPPAAADEPSAEELAALEAGTGGAEIPGNPDDPLAARDDLLAARDGGTKPSAPSKRPSPGKSSAPSPAAGDPAPAEAEPAPVEPEPAPAEADPLLPEPKPKADSDDGEVECLLNPDLPKCQTNSGPKRNDGEVLAPKLPEKLSSSQLRSGFSKIKSKAKACGGQHGAEAGTKVKVHVSIEGTSGKVTKVDAKGEHAGTPLGNCVEKAVESASFEKFKRPAMGVDYSLSM